VNPIEALDYAIMSAFVSSRRMKPGELVSHLPKDVREQLQQLTSKDALNMRVEWS
jgi:hypothetical protein